ncbi:MAG: DUF547 domain-containing protein, partial [Planctomycetota bacterium]|nr:DUF547 domain-containing protein [Planctomycetota bacterium]
MQKLAHVATVCFTLFFTSTSALECFGDSKPAKPKSGDSVKGQPQDYDYILKKYVKGDYFDYRALAKNKQDIARFNAFMAWQADADLKAMDRADQIAFYINAYNACCIKAVLDNYSRAVGRTGPATPASGRVGSGLLP